MTNGQLNDSSSSWSLSGLDTYVVEQDFYGDKGYDSEDVNAAVHKASASPQSTTHRVVAFPGEPAVLSAAEPRRLSTALLHPISHVRKYSHRQILNVLGVQSQRVMERIVQK